MENKKIFLCKLQKQGCYVNNGKYGYFLTCEKKNYKIPEWLKPEELTLDMAERILAYKRKYQRNGIKNKTINKLLMFSLIAIMKVKAMVNLL